MVTVHGRNILPGAELLFDGNQARSVEVLDDRRIRGLTPAHPGCVELVDIEIINPDGQRGVGAKLFHYFYEKVEFTETPTIPLDHVAAGVGALEDVTNDGILDLLIVREDISSYEQPEPGLVCFMEGLGGGEYKHDQCSPVIDMTPVDIVVGEFTGDSKVDLAVANFRRDCISILEQKEYGTFDEIFRIPLEQRQGPSRLEAGDFDGDGDLDLVVTAQSFSDFVPTRAWVLVGINRGDGWLDFTEIHRAEGMYVAGLALGDLDGDGNLDIVHSQMGEVFGWSGRGDGSFELMAQWQLTSTSRPLDMVYALELAKYDDDDFDDIYAITGEAILLPPEKDGELVILNGLGNGHFVSVARHNIGPRPGDMTVKSLNGDGFFDVAVESQDDSTATVFRGERDIITLMGSYSVGWSPSNGRFPSGRLLSGDINSDNLNDLLVINSEKVSTLLNQGDFEFEGQRAYRSGKIPIGLVAADYTDDGIVDLAISNVDDQTIKLLVGQGDGTFVSGSVFELDFGARIIEGYNLDKDKDIEIVLARPGTLAILDLKTSGEFDLLSQVGFDCDPEEITAGDWDHDGFVDLAVLDGGLSFFGVQTLRGSEEGTFIEWEFYDLGGGYLLCFASGDIDEDGWLDLLVGRRRARVSEIIILKGLGNGLFVSMEMSIENTMTTCSLGDYDGDGHLDLMVGITTSNEERETKGELKIYRGNGLGGFNVGSVVTIFEDPWPPSCSMPNLHSAPVDIDGDYASDLLALDRTEQGLDLFRIDNTTGEFRSPEYYETGGFISGIAVADFDGDGDNDVAAVGTNIQVRILINGLGACEK